MKRALRLPALILLFAHPVMSVSAQEKPLWENSAFQLYPDRVVQQGFTGQALSDRSLASNYQSPANLFQSPSVTFKFSINGKDNEMKPGVDHHYHCSGGTGNYTTPLIEFGKPLVDNRPLPRDAVMAPNTRLTIRLNMRPVLEALKKDGFYSTWDGKKIYAADFKSVYLAGATSPLSWDFDNLFQKPELHMLDPDGDGIYETTVVFNEEKKEKDLAASWQLSRNTSAFPQYHSPHPIADAIYNLSLEEMEKAIEPDSTFRTGKEWAGVWTRDISYSITLSMAYLQPKVAMYSLMKKVKNGKIIQDTGTGGAYPCSTDRMIWAMAAWQIYLATGDQDWLKNSYAIIKRSVEDDRHNAFDKLTGLVKGESSFLDWREQTYPKWMQPADIYESFNLGTNAVHFQASRVLSLMAKELRLSQDATVYEALANKIKQAINVHLWIPGKGYYGQYLYGRTSKILSPRSEALGEALCVLFGIAGHERAKSVIEKTPQLPFGIPCIYPQIDHIAPYHNRAVWPFVQSYWAMAAARSGNEEAVMSSIASIYRPAALFLTNKENFVADNGDYKGTEINSSNMLWSLSGNIALVHKIIFGMSFETDGLHVNPFVPGALAGKRSLSNIRYRDAIISISLEGYGNHIRSASINGRPVKQVLIPAGSKGVYDISIILDDQEIGGTIHVASNLTSPPTPIVIKSGNSLQWAPVDGAVAHDIIQNGKVISRITDSTWHLSGKSFNSYQVMAVDKNGTTSFASEPVEFNTNGYMLIEAEDFVSKSGLPYKGFNGSGFVETGTAINRSISITANIPGNGAYIIDIRYANGQGPVNTENKCGIRTLLINNKNAGVLVFPQRGNEEWSNWGFSNPLRVNLQKGKTTLTLSLLPENENMNGNINGAMIDYIRIRKL